VIARTEAITEMGVHPPSGYTVGKMWEDRSIGAPEPVSLTIVELVKKPS
jgi:hypothetical protein